MGKIYIGGSSSGGGTYTIQELTADGTVIGFDYMVLVDASANNVKVTLPTTNTTTTKGHSINIKRVDNTNNIVSIVPSTSTEMIEGVVNGTIYLYGKNDAVTLTSQGTGDCKITADNRNGTGSTANYLRVVATANQTISAVNTVVKFDTVNKVIGTSIAFDNTTDSILLKAGSSYRIRGSAGYIYCSASANLVYCIRTGASGGTGTILGYGQVDSDSAVGNYNSSSPIAETVYDATVDTYIHMETLTSTTTQIGNGQIYPWIEVEEITKQVAAINTVDNVYGRIGVTQVSSADVIIALASINGNIKVSNNIIYLKAGKTYAINTTARVTNASSSIAINPYLYNLTTSTNLTSTSLVAPSWSQNNDMPNSNMLYIITPTVDTQLQYRGNNAGGGSPNIEGYFTITQIGSTATTNVPMSLISEIQDKASSGYLDIGTTRIQWGTVASGVTGAQVITLPTSFANTTYSVTANINNPSNASTVFSVLISEKSQTNFKATKTYSGGYAAEGFSWIAIGMKP